MFKGKRKDAKVRNVMVVDSNEVEALEGFESQIRSSIEGNPDSETQSATYKNNHTRAATL